MSKASDLPVSLEEQFRAAQARCEEISAAMPSGMAIARGEAQLTDEQRAEYKAASDARMAIVLERDRAWRAARG